MMSKHNIAGIFIEYDKKFEDKCLRHSIDVEVCTNLIGKYIDEFQLSKNIAGLYIDIAEHAEEATLHNPNSAQEIVKIDIHPEKYEYEVHHELIHLRDQFDPEFGWNPDLLEGKSKTFLRTLNDIWDVRVDLHMGHIPYKVDSIDMYEGLTGDTGLFEYLLANPNISYPEMVSLAIKIESAWG